MKCARLKGTADDLGRRSPARSSNLSLFNERSRVILGQVLCRDDMLDAVPGDERDGAAADRIKHTGLIRTIAEMCVRTGYYPKINKFSSSFFFVCLVLSPWRSSYYHQQGFIVQPVI